MLTTPKFAATLLLSLSLATAAGSAFAEQKNGSGPTQAQIDCQNRAVNDYYDQLKECDKALSDLPNDNAQCQSDARSDLDRRKAACTAQMTVGVKGNLGVLATGGVLDTGKGLTLKRLQGKATTTGATIQ